MKKLLLVASFALTLNVFAQKVGNELSFQKGQKLEMVVNVNSTVSQGMAGESKVQATITRIFDVNDVANGSATIEHKLKRIQINFETPMITNVRFGKRK